MKKLASLMLLISSLAFAAQPLESKEQVAAAFANGRPMVILFSAEWCGACKMIKPEFLKAEKALEGKVDFYTMDVDKLRLRTEAEWPGAIPTMLSGTSEADVRSGKSYMTGFREASEIIKYVKSNTKVK